MLKGYSLPLSPRGEANLVPNPPWYYVGNVLAIEYEADTQWTKSYLPKVLELDSSRCCIYFIDWQYVSEEGEEYLNPLESQYKETIILMSAKYKGEPLAYCPYIWVNQDKSMMRGIFQGWPKQYGDTQISKRFTLDSKAAPKDRAAGTLTVYGRRYIEGHICQLEDTSELPRPTFAGSALLRYFPNLEYGKHQIPLINELVQLKSRGLKVGPIRKGLASLDFLVDHRNEVSDFRPLKVLGGYQFEVSLIVDDIKLLEKL